jgi:transposase
MKPIDGRTLSHEVSEHIRIMAVRRVREGERPSDVIRSYGMCRTTIHRWLRAARRGGEKALASRKAPGPAPKLTPRQKRQVFRWINGKDPRQYGFDFGLWTRKIVQALVRERFGIELSVTAVGRMLAELEITPQKPLRRAYERDPAAIAKWVQEDYPRLRARARRRGARIFFLDEAGVRSDAVLGRSWAPKGQTPEVATSGRRQSVNAISAINARGEFWYKVYTQRLNKELFLHFLKAFLRGRRISVFLVVDGHPAHRARIIAEYVQSLKGRLEIHFLPGYAPELNPDEFVWNHLKKEGVSKKPLHQGESLRARVHQDLERIRRAPALVRSFFRAPSVSYATD